MKNKKGFTLVELLAVIVILGVLLLVAVPAVSTVITNSRKGADRDEAIEFLNAVANCTLANGNATVCTAEESITYLNASNAISAGYSNSTISGDTINLENFYFKGANGYVVYFAGTKSINDLKNGITKAGNGEYVTEKPASVNFLPTGASGYVPLK